MIFKKKKWKIIKIFLVNKMVKKVVVIGKDYGNRNGCVQWFFTFPRWVQYPDIKIFKTFFKDAKWAKVVMESHEEPDDDLSRNSMIHYHISMVLNHKLTKSQFKKKMEALFPNDYKRIDFEPTRDREAVLSYLEKQELECYEWGTLRVIPKWAREIHKEWTNPELIARVNAEEKRQRLRQDEHDEWLYECEHPICVICGKRDLICCDYCDWKV